MTITELARSDWGAGPLTEGHPVPAAQMVGLVVHHTVIVLPDYDHDGLTGGDIDDARSYMRQLQHARPDLGLEVPYSWVVLAGAGEHDAILAEGRGLTRTGAHTIGYNSTRQGVAFAGDFTDHAPTPGMWAAVGAVGRKLTDPAGAQRTLEHRDVYRTACPGASTPLAPTIAQPPFPIPTNLKELPVRMIVIFPDGSGYLADTSSGLFVALTADGAAALERAGVPRVPFGDVGPTLTSQLTEIRNH